jgi:hypothetical protein
MWQAKNKTGSSLHVLPLHGSFASRQFFSGLSRDVVNHNWFLLLMI